MAVGGNSGPRVAAAAGLTPGADGWSGVDGAHAAPIRADPTSRTAAGPTVTRRRARPLSITPRYAPGRRVDAYVAGGRSRTVSCRRCGASRTGSSTPSLRPGSVGASAGCSRRRPSRTSATASRSRPGRCSSPRRRRTRSSSRWRSWPSTCPRSCSAWSPGRSPTGSIVASWSPPSTSSAPSSWRCSPSRSPRERSRSRSSSSRCSRSARPRPSWTPRAARWSRAWSGARTSGPRMRGWRAPTSSRTS